MEKKIIITGGTGFLGKRLESILNKNMEITNLSLSTGGDILKYSCFKDIKASHVIHLAAKTKGNDEDDMFKINVYGTLNALEFCKESKADLVFASSAAIYGNVPSPIKETAIPKPISFYGKTKLIGENLCKLYNKEHGINVKILRIFNIYGPGQNKGFLIPDILTVLENEKTTLRNPNPKRDFVYVDDVVNAIIKSLDLDCSETMNIGAGQSYSVREIVEKINYDKKKVIYGNNTLDKSDIYSDIGKAKKIMGWKPKISLDEGISILLKNQNR